MSDRLYYTPPTDEQFDELKEKAMELWMDVDSDKDAYGYVTEKRNRIKDIPNVKDNFMYMVSMFDHGNMCKLATKLSEDTRKAVKERMLDGGYDLFLIPF